MARRSQTSAKKRKSDARVDSASRAKKFAESSEPEPAKPHGRGPGRRFQKGQSGNPGGLSAERRAFLLELRKAEEPHARLVVEKLRSLALKGTQWALVDYLDRLGVRMPDKLELSGEDGAPLPTATTTVNALDPTAMTSEQVRKGLEAIRAEREELLREAGGPAPVGPASGEPAADDSPPNADGPEVDST